VPLPPRMFALVGVAPSVPLMIEAGSSMTIGFAPIDEPSTNVSARSSPPANPVTVAPVKSTVEPAGKSVVMPDRPMINDVVVTVPTDNALIESIVSVTIMGMSAGLDASHSVDCPVTLSLATIMSVIIISCRGLLGPHC